MDGYLRGPQRQITTWSAPLVGLSDKSRACHRAKTRVDFRNSLPVRSRQAGVDMKITLFIVAWCLCTTALISTAASSADGRIGFSGAVVEPTCSVAADDHTIAAAIAPRVDAQRLACAKSDAAMAAAPRIYSLTTEKLSSSESDRLLKYFEAYVKANRIDASAPVLLTQTYE